MNFDSQRYDGQVENLSYDEAPMQEHFRRRHLPHWDSPGATYFITGCLAGSISASGRLDIERYRRALQQRIRPAGLSKEDWDDQKSRLLFAKHDEWLDTQPAVRHLEDAALAKIVMGAMRHFASVRYDLFAFVVMPSHFHWVFQPRGDWTLTLGGDADVRTPRERIMQSFKRFSALKCNEALGRTGVFWQDETYDRCVRDEGELERIVAYVEANPVKAGLAANAEE